MSKILKVSQDNYRVQVQTGGQITLDTGTGVIPVTSIVVGLEYTIVSVGSTNFISIGAASNTVGLIFKASAVGTGSGTVSQPAGTVVVIGNLEVRGVTSTIESTNTSIADNIIQLNVGQTGDGISLSSPINGQSGIAISRGNYPDAKILFDETVEHYDQTTDSNLPGTFSFQFTGGALAGIQTASIAAGAGSNLNLDMQNQPVVASIVNADPVSYSLRVTAGNGNVIPNKQFLVDYIQSGIVVAGQADVDRIYKGHGLPVTVDTEVLANASNIQFFVRSSGTLNQRAQITASGLSVDDINLYSHSITNTGLSNLVITSVSSNEVEIDSILDLTDQTGSVVVTPNKTKIYSKATAGPGKTGLFIANSNTSDELVSKNRAVLLSILL